MKKIIYFIFILMLLLQSCASPKLSEEYTEGKVNFEAGNYKRAFRVLLPLAAKGKVEAQYAVGYMYYYGYGTAQDNESGLFWMNKAAELHYLPAIHALNLLQHTSPRSEKKETTLPPPKISFNYSLQLMGAYEIESVENLQKKLNLKNNTTISRAKYNGKDWYILLYGQYNTAKEANLALENASEKIRVLHPWVKKIV